MAQGTTTRTAANVRAELARAGVSGRSAALALGWSPSRMARRLSGETPFTVEEVAALAQHLEIPLGVLIHGLDTAGAA